MDSDSAKKTPNTEPHPLALAEERHQLALYEGMGAGRQMEEDEDVINLRDYWRVIMARKGTILLVTFLVVVATLISTSLQTPIYRSSTTLQIEREAGKVLQYEGVTAESGRYDWEFYQTQYELLKSKTLAQRVVDELGLESSAQFMSSGEEKKSSFFSDIRKAIKGFIQGDEEQQQQQINVTDEESSGPDLAGILRGGLTVSPVRDSKLVVVSYDSPNAQLAARVANAIAKNFVNTTLERRFEASSYAKTFLAERIKQVRAELEDSERTLAKYAQEREIIDLEEKQSILMHKIRELDSKLVESEAQRIEDEAKYIEMKDAVLKGNLNVLESPVIQAYKERLVQLEAEYEEKLHIYKPAYPTMVQLQQRIDEVQGKIDEEIQNIRTAALTKYKAAQREEAMLKARMAEIKTEILDLQNRSRDYQVLKRDVETNRELYDGLSQRMKEVGVASGIGTNNISVVDKAEVAGAPYKPNLKKNLMIALVLGLFGGIGLAFLFDHLDDTIKSGADLEKLTGLAVLGIVPEINKQRESVESVALLTYEQPTSALAEAYRSIRTALTFATASGSPKVLHLTSSGAGEGKTTSAIALATAYTQSGSNVLLVDADLRNPSLHQELGLHNEVGLTNYLAANYKPSQVVQQTGIANLWVLPTGPIPPNPAELLSSGKMVDFINTAAKKFDMVIIDSPPVLGLADALVLANMAQATILVVDAGVTRTGSVEGSMQRLKRARANITGTLLVKYGQGGSGYGYDYHYSYSYYGYGSDEADDEPRKQMA